MTIGVTLNGNHCFDFYGMWLTNVDITEPEVQTHYVQVPGRNGELDLTTVLTGEPNFYNGTLTMTFQTTEKVCGNSWLDQLYLVQNEMHGKEVTADFDDGYHSFSGRCEVSGTPVAGGIFEIEVTMSFSEWGQ